MPTHTQTPELRQVPECMQIQKSGLSTLRSPHLEASVTASSRDRSLTADRWPRCFPPTTRTVCGIACTSAATPSVFYSTTCLLCVWCRGEVGGGESYLRKLLGAEKQKKRYSNTLRHSCCEGFGMKREPLPTARLQSCAALRMLHCLASMIIKPGCHTGNATLHQLFLA